MDVRIAALLACFLCLAAGYPNGAPDSACNAFTPNHIRRSTKQPYTAKNEGDDDDNDCPYELRHTKFVPGEQLTLNLLVKNSTNYFRGYLLSIVEHLDSGYVPRGTFSSSSNVICSGSAITQSSGDRKTSEAIHWTAPADSANKKYAVWLTVVKSFSRFWTDCSQTEISAEDAEDNADPTQQNPTSVEVPDENKNSDAVKDDHDHEDSKQDSHSHPDDDASEDELDSSVSSEDLNSEGGDDSGYSNENSIDVSDNRSGSSLNSDEKEERRTKYFEKGIKNFDGDIKKFLTKIGKPELFKQTQNAATTYTGVTGLVILTLAIVNAL